ncbi:7-cyano-7-deazaguanine synthase [Pseudodesulfovibrio sp.]|nr:7-cyano-7-deazaguanine synthase [Pseudodesulfovibrio sp.]
MTQTILAMYSGGLDSAGVVYRLLKDDEFAEFDVHVHHMHVVNRENRAMAEGKAVARTLKLFAGDGFRPYKYTESLHRFDFMRRDIVWDMDLCAFVAGNICAADPAIKHVAMGRTRTDVASGGDDFLKRMERAQTVFQAVISLDETEASYIFPVVDMTKQEIWDMLPEPIAVATWSCRRPVYDDERNPSPCGACATCKERAEFPI